MIENTTGPYPCPCPQILVLCANAGIGDNFVSIDFVDGTSFRVAQGSTPLFYCDSTGGWHYVTLLNDEFMKPSTVADVNCVTSKRLTVKNDNLYNFSLHHHRRPRS